VTPAVAGPVDPGTALLRAGTRLALAAAVVVAAVSLFWGWRALLAAAIGGLVATAALAVGPALLHAVRDASAPVVTAAATGGYAAVVVVLGLVFAVLAPASWLSAEHLAAALVVVTVAGIAGQARAVTRLRVLVFSERSAEGGRTPHGGLDGDGAQSGQNLPH
jgi:hypothetical protein